MSSMSTLSGRAKVLAVHSVPAPFIDGVVKTREENRAEKWERIRYTLATAVSCPTSSAFSERMSLAKAGTIDAPKGDSHGRYGRKNNKRNRGNKRWECLV